MKKILLLAMIILVLSACGKSEESTNSSNGDVIKPIDAVLDVPEKLVINEAVTLSVTVTQDEEAVDDASEIEFEVWKNGEKEESKMIQANHQKNGVYTAEETFDENGIYYVQSHVTARDMHTMPKAKVTVGEVTEKETEVAKEADKESGEHHHHSNTTIDFQMPETVTVNEASAYVANVTHKGEPLENALVRLEVWEDGSKKHEYVNLNEAETGTYQTEMKLDNKGTYQIKVHVEKDEIHTHKEFEVEVEY